MESADLLTLLSIGQASQLALTKCFLCYSKKVKVHFVMLIHSHSSLNMCKCLLGFIYIKDQYQRKAICCIPIPSVVYEFSLRGLKNCLEFFSS